MIVWIVIALAMSTKNAPTSGTTMNDRGLAPCALVIAVMTAIAVGVAPMDRPKYPEVETAAS